MNKMNIFTNSHLVQLQKAGDSWVLYAFSEVGGQKCDEMTTFPDLKNAYGYAKEKYFPEGEALI